MNLHSGIVPVADLSAPQVDTLQSLMESHYDGVSTDKFRADLHDKDRVLLIENGRGAIVGFSTMLLSHMTMDGQTVRVLFSGDTVVDEAYWGQTELFRMFVRMLASLLEESSEPLYWLLLTKGIRTYLLLPAYFKAFNPGAGQPHREFECALANRFASARYGAQFRREEGVVRLSPPGDRLKPAYAEIPPRRLDNPHVRFYKSANPGCDRGDELVSIARVSYNNFTRAMTRFLRQS